MAPGRLEGDSPPVVLRAKSYEFSGPSVAHDRNAISGKVEWTYIAYRTSSTPMIFPESYLGLRSEGRRLVGEGGK